MELAGTLYVDGHVRLYHGQQTKLPRRYVARQRLCLRGTTDYWVNDALGQPFFSVERPVDHGLLEALRNDVVPRLIQDVPGQPTAEQLQTDPYLSRFVIIFDREGYSPTFFREMWQQHRIACISYHKYPKPAWPESWFSETQVTMPGGEIVTMKLAEMGSWIGDRNDGLWVREVRKLTTCGHQTSLISTAYGQPGLDNAAQLFSRWCQENFFRYMMSCRGCLNRCRIFFRVFRVFRGHPYQVRVIRGLLKEQSVHTPVLDSVRSSPAAQVSSPMHRDNSPAEPGA